MALPEKLQAIVDSFKLAPKSLRLQLLLEYANKLPPLPAELQGQLEKMERVPECQTPFFLASEYLDDEHVIFHFEAPPEAPTTRGFAGILAAGLSGLSSTEIFDVPDDFYTDMGLSELISPLRLRGMSAIMHRLKRQVLEHKGSV